MLNEKELNELRKQVEANRQKAVAMDREIDRALYRYLKEHSTILEVNPVRIRFDEGCYEEEGRYSSDCSNGEITNYEVRCDVSFRPYLEDDLLDGKYSDFGSSFELIISKNHIYLNEGAIGTYSTANKGQIARKQLTYYLISKEDEVVEMIRKLIDLDFLNEAKELQHKLYKAEQEIEHAKKEAQVKEATSLLRNSVNKVLMTTDYSTRTTQYGYIHSIGTKRVIIVKYSEYDNPTIEELDSVYATRGSLPIEKVINNLINGTYRIVEYKDTIEEE